MIQWQNPGLSWPWALNSMLCCLSSFQMLPIQHFGLVFSLLHFIMYLLARRGAEKIPQHSLFSVILCCNICHISSNFFRHILTALFLPKEETTWDFNSYRSVPQTKVLLVHFVPFFLVKYTQECGPASKINNPSVLPLRM